MKNTFIKIGLVSLLTITATTSFLGCNRSSNDKNDTSAVTATQESPASLFARLPGNTVGFLRFRTDSDSYKQYKKSPWGQTKILDSLPQAPTTGGFDFKALEAVFKKVGLITTDPNQVEAISEGVAFVSGTGTNLNLGMFLTSTSGQNLKDKLVAVREELVRQGLKTKDEAVANKFAFSLDNGTSPTAKLVYFVADADNCGIATDLKIASRAFPATTKEDLTLKSSQYFVKTMQGVGKSKNPLVVGYLDIAGALPMLKAELSKTDPTSAVVLDQIPVQALAFERSFDGQLSDSMAVSLEGKNDEQKGWITAISGSGTGNSMFSVTPGDVLASITLDGKTLQNLKTIFLAQAAQSGQPVPTEELKVIDSINRLQIALRDAGATSPFPEILILLGTSDSASFATNITTMLKGGLGASGMPVGPWNDGNIGGMQASYTQTPLGIGLYVGHTDGFVVIASSDRILTDISNAASTKENTLLAKLSPAGKELLADSPSIFTTYIDFPKLSSTIEAAQGNLAMFTGGQPVGDPTTINNFKQLGRMMYAARMKDGLLIVDGRFTAN